MNSIKEGKTMDAKTYRREMRSRQKEKNKALMCFAVVLFVILSALLVMQRNQVNKLDLEIKALNSEYDTIVRINDDLQGQLLSARNLSEVENYASAKLGMVSASAVNISYVSYAVQTASSDEIVASAETFVSWISGLFK